jgi:hypothetical protein
LIFLKICEMGSCEATNVVLAKVKNFDPENASKIMGYLLMNLEEYELVRLACCPDHVIHNLAIRVKTHLGMTLSTPSSPSPLNPIGRIVSSSTNPFSKSSPRGVGSVAVSNGFDFNRNPPSPSSNVWPQPSFQKNPISSKFNPLLSYENIQTGVAGVGVAGSSSFSPRVNNGGDCDFVDEQQLNEYFPFLNEGSNGDDLVDPRLEMNLGSQNWISGNNGDTHNNIHRRSYSANDASFGVEESGLGFGFKPCLYFARGFCKNGSNCKFVHGDSMDANSAAIVGSPSKFEGLEQHEEFMRFKAAQHQRLVAASQLAAGGTSPSSYDKYIDFLMQQHNDNQRFIMEFV